MKTPIERALEAQAQGPDFAAWRHENLARFANEAYHRMREQEDALAQLRADFKDAMRIIRQLHERNSG